MEDGTSSKMRAWLEKWIAHSIIANREPCWSRLSEMYFLHLGVGARHRLVKARLLWGLRAMGFPSSFQTHSWHLRWKAQVWLHHNLPFCFLFYLCPIPSKLHYSKPKECPESVTNSFEECNAIASAKYDLALICPITLVSFSVLPSQEIWARWNCGEVFPPLSQLLSCESKCIHFCTQQEFNLDPKFSAQWSSVKIAAVCLLIWLPPERC